MLLTSCCTGVIPTQAVPKVEVHRIAGITSITSIKFRRVYSCGVHSLVAWCHRSVFPGWVPESRRHKRSLVLTPAVPHQDRTGRGRKAGKGSYVLGIIVETRKSGVGLQLGIIFLGLGKFEQSWESLQPREEEVGGGGCDSPSLYGHMQPGHGHGESRQ